MIRTHLDLFSTPAVQKFDGFNAKSILMLSQDWKLDLKKYQVQIVILQKHQDLFWSWTKFHCSVTFLSLCNSPLSMQVDIMSTDFCVLIYISHGIDTFVSVLNKLPRNIQLSHCIRLSVWLVVHFVTLDSVHSALISSSLNYDGPKSCMVDICIHISQCGTGKFFF